MNQVKNCGIFTLLNLILYSTEEGSGCPIFQILEIVASESRETKKNVVKLTKFKAHIRDAWGP